MTLKESLMTIKDFRIDRCKKHNLCDILMIVLIGYLTGCKDIEEIHFKCRLTKDGESTELRYFITSLTDVNLAAKAMRAHWSIENNLHWVLDTVFDEDYCRVRKDNSAQNLNIIRKLVMNLLKELDLPVATKKKNLPIGNKQTLCLKNEKCLLYALQNL